jgi:hypothetical protein
MFEFDKYKDDATLQQLIYASTAIQDRNEEMTVESLARQLILNHANPMPDYDEMKMYTGNRKRAIEYLSRNISIEE